MIRVALLSLLADIMHTKNVKILAPPKHHIKSSKLFDTLNNI